MTAVPPPETARGGASLSQQALQAQTGLLPYALMAFAVSLPIYVWAGGHAPNAAWMSASFVVFAIAWGMFYAVVNWLKEPAAQDLRRRARVQLLAGLIWAAAPLQLAAFAEAAGPARETLLMISLAAGVMCLVFTAPWLPSLLVVGTAAVAGPLFALTWRATNADAMHLAWGGTALAFALALMVNRILRSQFALAAEREGLMAERAEQAEAARRLARSKSDLVATLSDEIRNGLTGVAHVLAAAAGRGGRAAPSREQLAAGLDAVNDLLSVLNTTLDAETAEAGRLSVQLEPIDVVAIARDLVSAHRLAAAAKGLEISLHLGADLAPTLHPSADLGAAIGDPARVRQVLAALIGNAVRFTLRGRVEVRIGLPAGGRLAIEIADTGPGLSEDELALAFQPFQRIARTSAGTSGAGLGLTLARQLARLMGGGLSAHSAAGVGSCFTIELPYEAQASIPPPLSAEDQALAADRPRLRILVAEDDGLSAATLRSHLEQLGHKVAHAADGGRAVELNRVCDFDVLMVAASAASDGPHIMAQIRKLDGAAGRTPLVALIGGDPGEAEESLAAGASAVLRKPFTMPALARALADALAVKACANDRDVA
ncbi:ATP-binding response regulator [Phenylobacterium sp.]|uniref:ATP-binding response regulator n=1 Tax=Phenylobacterium sp. TaxID=1871053 RepID=UPI002DE74976|nr:ATP-binding protein [Phenylobacterium sp.]